MRRAVLAAIVGVAAILAIGALAYAATRTGPTPAPDRQTVAAPIDDLQVVVRESNPPQVTLKVKAGLPSGCAKRDTYTVDRAADTITVRVLNTMPTGNQVCTMIYGTYELSIDLGTDFRPGVTYTVRVNDKTATFKT
jgi:hypothetical protein